MGITVSRAAAMAALTLAAMWAQAQPLPTGTWKTFDDRTQKPRSVVTISETAGTLTGVIRQRLDSEAKPTDVCDKCTDDRKDHPIEGLQIIRGAMRAIDNEARWEGGRILDPETGKEYQLRLTLIDGGRKLEVRGFVGTSMIGRTQVWMRAEQ